MEKTQVSYTSKGIKIKKANGDQFEIPIVNMTVSESEERRGNRIIKASNRQQGSKFFRPTNSLLGYSYNESFKN